MSGALVVATISPRPVAVLLRTIYAEAGSYTVQPGEEWAIASTLGPGGGAGSSAGGAGALAITTFRVNAGETGTLGGSAVVHQSVTRSSAASGAPNGVNGPAGLSVGDQKFAGGAHTGDGVVRYDQDGIADPLDENNPGYGGKAGRGLGGSQFEHTINFSGGGSITTTATQDPGDGDAVIRLYSADPR